MDRPVVTQEIINLYDEYTHAPLERRVFLGRLAALAGSTAAAAAILPYLGPQKAAAAMVAPDDQRLDISSVTYPGTTGPVRAYAAKPKGAAGRLGAVIVIHENRGTNPHIQDVTRRLALEGFVAIAPDFLSPQGGTPTDDDKAREMFARIDSALAARDAVAAIAYAKNRPDCNGKVGMVGFCWGGGIVNRAAAASPDLAAGVPYYGTPPPADQVKNIKARMMLHYAALDTRVTSTAAGYEQALKEAGVSVQAFVYEGANHAFNNDTSPDRYVPAAANLAWSRTIAFFKATLR
jgi:carboxymethylenebutenolidase